jgi:phospho-N-acetylmuramoyl-pentapeptide-transferase
MLQLLSGNPRTVDALGFLLAFALTALMDSVFHDKLPHDHGRAFAVNGELSKGKARGSGLIFVLCIALVTLAVVPFKAEYVIYTVLLIASMLSGYFDDAAETAWNEYKKGLIDLVIAVVAGVTYLNFNGTEVNFLSWSFSLPYAVYLILIIVLIWASINVVKPVTPEPAAPTPVPADAPWALLALGGLLAALGARKVRSQGSV